MEDIHKFPKIAYPSESDRLQYGKPFLLTEKIDGANARIHLRDDALYLGSRKRLIAKIVGGKVEVLEPLGFFDGFVALVEANWDRVIEEMRSARVSDIYGEWLVPHTVLYPKERYHRFYVFPLYAADEDPPLAGIFDTVPRFGFYTPKSLGDLAFDAVAAAVGLEPDQPFEGFVFYDEEGPAFKVVRPQFSETFATLHGMKKHRAISESPELQLIARFPARSMVKVYEKVRDALGREPMAEDLPRLLQQAVEEFFCEHFLKAAKKTGFPKLDSGLLFRELKRHAREFYLSRIRLGEWPVTTQIALRKGGKGDG